MKIIFATYHIDKSGKKIYSFTAYRDATEVKMNCNTYGMFDFFCYGNDDDGD